jgi:hypothetical protein
MTRKLKRLLRAYVNAEIEYSWMGAAAPESYAEIENDLEKTRAKLERYLDRLETAALTEDGE